MGLPTTEPKTKMVSITRDRGWIKFSIPMLITSEEASTLQADLGYHPAGYGKYCFNASENMTTWQCSSSCD